MSAAVILAIIVASGESQSPATRALVAACSDALGAGVSVELHEAATPSDREAAKLEAATGPRAVAEVLWSGAGHVSARVRLHVARTDRWIDRTIDFEAADSLSERGRALGFALASMLPEADPALQIAAAPSATPLAPVPRALGRPRRAVGLAALANDGIAGPAAGLGGMVDVAFAVGESVAVRASAALWRGSIAEIAATDLTAQLGAGAAWTPIAPAPERPWELGLRADALVVYQAVSHVHATGTTAWKAKVLPGVDVMLEGGWHVTRGCEVFVAAGPEIVLGTIDVAVISSAVTAEVTLPALRAVAQVGLRLHF
jgi:hypothetical protein